MARSVTVMFEVPTPGLITAEAKLDAIHARLKEMVLNRMSAMAEETQTIASDMDALRLRIKSSGHRANIEDIRSARWYRTRDQFVLARDLYRFVCGVLGEDEAAIWLAEYEEPDDAVPADLDG